MKTNKLKVIIVAMLLIAMLFAITACGEEKCSVVFMDGESEFSKVEIDKGEKLTLPTPTKEGYKFVHWCVDSELKVPYDGAEVNSALTLYAKFEKQSIYVSVNSNGGSAVQAVEVEYNKNYTIAAPTREGYRFVGYTYDNGETDVDFPLTGIYPYKNGIRVRANWAIETGSIGLSGEGDVDESTLLFVDKGAYFKERASLDDEFTYVFTTGSIANFTGVTISVGNTSLVTLNDEKNSFTVGHTPGEFTITVKKGNDSYNRDAKIVKQIYTMTDGADLNSTSQANITASDFVNKEKQVTEVGKNNFKPDLSIKDALNNAMTLAEAEILVSIVDSEDNVVTDYTIDENDVITFGQSLVGKTLTITFKGKYDASKVKKTVSQTVVVNEGVNVYTDAELRQAYADLTVTEINILRNITATLTDRHYIPGTTDPRNETGYSVYSRKATNKASANCVINGNYFRIDGTSLPLINCDHYSGSSAYNGWGGTNYGSAKVQVAIFEFANYANIDASGSSQQRYNGNKLTVNNLRIDSNTNPSKKEETRSDLNDSKPVLVNSGAYNGINVRGGSAEYNNLVITKTKNAIWGEGGIYKSGETTYEHSVIIDINECHVINSFSNCIYMWDTSKVTITNSQLEEVAAATIHFYDIPHVEDVDQELNIDDYSLNYINNPKTGTEIWFKIYNTEALASNMKTNGETGLQQMLTPVGKGGQLTGVNNTVAGREGDEFINFVLIIERDGDNSLWTGDKDNKGKLYFDVHTGDVYKLHDFMTDAAEMQNTATQAAAVARVMQYKEGDLVAISDAKIIAYIKLYNGSVNSNYNTAA